MGCSQGSNSEGGNKPNSQSIAMEMSAEAVEANNIHARPEKIKGSLGNKHIKKYNECALRIKSYFRNQSPPEDEETLWQDDLFPPIVNSIFGKDSNGDPTDKFEERTSAYWNHFKVKEDDVMWLPANEIFTAGKYSVFEGSIECDDINQGSVGNCYFMSAMAAMAEFPELIVECFRTLKVTKNGCYEVVMRIHGKWQIVLLDSYFPVDVQTKKPKFSKPNGAEIWVMLLEKAWAKVNGGYLNINAGLVSDPLSTFTNFPTEYYRFADHTNKNEIWEHIKECENNNYIMATTSNFTKEMSSVGLVGGHAFSLISAKEATVVGKVVKLLKIRNPWGYKEWKGTWSDGSKEWTEEAKKAFGTEDHKNKDDGCFWMAFEDFLQYFINIETCMKQNNICSKGIECHKGELETPHVFQLTLDSKSSVSIQAIKRKWRFNRKIPPNPYLIVNIIVAKKGGEEYQWINGVGDCASDPLMKVDLEQGEYIVYVVPNYRDNTYDKKRKYVIQVTATSFFKFDFLDYDRKYDLLKELMWCYVEKSGKKNPRKQQDYVYIGKADSLSIGCVYIANYSNTDYVLEGPHDVLNMRDVTQEENHNVELALPGKAHGYKGICGVALVVFTRDKFYSSYSCGASKYKFVPKSCEQFVPDTERFLKSPENNSRIDSEDNYTWVHKQFKLDISKITETINQEEVLRNFIKASYPDKYKEMMKFSGPQDGVEVLFQDKYDFGNGSCYIGQWKKDTPHIRHGVGYYDWYSSGSAYVGDIKDGKFHGKGCMKWNNGTSVSIDYVNGQMHGIRIHRQNNGSEKKIQYANGKFVRWL